jgi:hypothetical protein
MISLHRKSTTALVMQYGISTITPEPLKAFLIETVICTAILKLVTSQASIL